MHNASAAIKNNDDSKNDGVLYKHTADVFIYIGAGDSWSQCWRCDLYNNEECTGMRCWHCRCLYTVEINLLFGVSHYIAQLVDIYI
jgi:hypothetical protein